MPSGCLALHPGGVVPSGCLALHPGGVVLSGCLTLLPLLHLWSAPQPLQDWACQLGHPQPPAACKLAAGDSGEGGARWLGPAG